MSVVSTRTALETQLATVTFTGGATAYENVPYTPVAGTPYQACYCLFASPDNPTMGDGFNRILGIFQVSLFYPLNTGPGAAATQAELIKTAFARGSSFTSGTVTVHIDRTPEISTGRVDGDRFHVPVRIPFYADIYS